MRGDKGGVVNDDGTVDAVVGIEVGPGLCEVDDDIVAVVDDRGGQLV